MSASDGSGPQPTAHEFEPGCTLSRRQILQSTAVAAGASAAGVTLGSERVLGDNFSFEGTCDSKLRFAFPVSCGFADPDSEIDEEGTVDEIEHDLHVSGQSLHDSLLREITDKENDLEDTDTLGSLDARNAIADAYEDGKSATEADADAKAAILEYFAHHQDQTLQMGNAHMAELAYLASTANDYEDIPEEFFHIGLPDDEEMAGEYQGSRLTGDTHTSTVELVDGTEKEVVAATMILNTSYNSEDYVMDFEPFGDWQGADANNEFITASSYDGGSMDIYWSGNFMVQNTTSGLESQYVYDYRPVVEVFERFEQQAQNVNNAYPDGLAEDLYAAMDAGELDPNDIRGAEGMVRYLSGDAEDSGQELTLALRHLLDLEGPDDLQSRMEIEFTGANDVERNEQPDGTVEYEPVEVDGRTYEGVMFARSPPGGVIETETTYATFDDRVSVLDESTYEEGGENEGIDELPGNPSVVVGGGEEVRLIEGEFTVTNLWDADGTEVDSLDMSGPEYESYDADEFIQALEESDDRRGEIDDDEDEDDVGDDDDEEEDGWGLPTFGGDGFGGDTFAGVAIIGVVVLAIVGFVTDLLPWT
ncbi:hypothetical protein [Natronococcus pandeyae]|uniref:hypothetical protein n=1 Tax=Natronococcus pandeyae TaxID=2055836 RepID=UPI001652DE8E|nr:hypothetical protein [Natronococcus pandeyae]